MMNVYLEHANITVRSLDEATRLLGAAFPDFRIRGGGEFRGRKWIHFGNDHTYLALNEYPEAQSEEKDYSHTGLNHMGFVVDDLDGIDQRLQAAGYEQDESFREESEFRRRHYYYDGNNMEWEFVEYLSDDPARRNDYPGS